jgi:hypothetical protein
MNPLPRLCYGLLLACALLNVCDLARAVGNPAAAGPLAPPADGQVCTSTNHGFQMMVPNGWTARETRFYIAHYSDGIMTINSQRPDLKIQNLGEAGTKTMSAQMLPGEVYITIGFSDGPGGVSMRPDTIGDNLRALLDTNRISAAHEAGLSSLDLRFSKRGKWWNISAYLREPVTEENRQKVMSLLASFRFLDAPVENVAWAESLAWNELPEQIRQPENSFEGWPVTDNLDQRPQHGPRSVAVKKNGDVYTVQFFLDGIGSWQYSVFPDGSVQSGRREVYAQGPTAAGLPFDLPGEGKGVANVFWIEPYVQVCETLRERTTTWYGEDGRIRRTSRVGEPSSGAGFFSHTNVVEGINEDWSITLPPAASTGDFPDERCAASTPDSRVLVYQFNPKPGLVALDVYIHGKRMNTLGPYLPCYPSYQVALNDDGSAALLVWQDAAKTNAQIVVLNTNGIVQFRADCGQNVWSPEVAPNGAGVLLRPNGGTNQNTFMWFTRQGKLHSLDVSSNPECVGWIPSSRKSLFWTSLGNESCRSQLIDWDSGKRLWDIPVPENVRPLAIGLTQKYVIFASAQAYLPAPGRSTDHPAPDGEWIRTFYTFDVQDGSLVAQWQAQLPHRGLERHRDHFIWLNNKFYYVTAEEFTEINLNDISEKKHGWR